jgi:hypothetical protein
MDEQKTEGRNQESAAQAASVAKADDPDSRRIKLRRVGSEPATCISFSYEDGSGSLQQWHPEPDKNEFEVKAIIAVAAVASGFFEEAPESKTKLKKT